MSEVGPGGGGERRGRTFEFVFADVDGGGGVDYIGGEVVDHCCRWCGAGRRGSEEG